MWDYSCQHGYIHHDICECRGNLIKERDALKAEVERLKTYNTNLINEAQIEARGPCSRHQVPCHICWSHLEADRDHWKQISGELAERIHQIQQALIRGDAISRMKNTELIRRYDSISKEAR